MNVKKNIILDEVKYEKNNLEKFIEERIEENKELFTEEELTAINNNNIIVKKIYLLGFKNSIDCYKI